MDQAQASRDAFGARVRMYREARGCAMATSAHGSRRLCTKSDNLSGVFVQVAFLHKKS